MTLLIIYLLIALVFSFLCSISEAVVLSVRPSYVQVLVEKKASGAKALKALKDNLDRPLAAILTLNTIAHTIGAAGVGAQVTLLYGDEALGIASAILTLLILILSEIIPKTLGISYARTLAPMLAPFILALTKILFPFVWLSEKLTRLLAPSGGTAFTFSRDELRAMAEIGVGEGHIEQKELKIVTNLMKLHKLSVRDIMTPRTVIFTVPASMKVQTFFEEYANKPFSRIPIYGDGLDDIVGYVLKSELLAAQARDEFNRELKDFSRSFVAVHDSKSVSEVFDRLALVRSHIGLVVDQFGTIQGIVTLEDVMETLIGLEITDESDTVADMQAFAHRRWKERVSELGIDPDSLEIKDRSKGDVSED